LKLFFNNIIDHHVIPNLYDFLSSVKHTWGYLERFW